MKYFFIILFIFIGSTVFADDKYAPKEPGRINLYKVVSDNENAPMYSGYYRDSKGVLHQVAVWSGTSDKYLEGSVTPID